MNANIRLRTGKYPHSRDYTGIHENIRKNTQKCEYESEKSRECTVCIYSRIKVNIRVPTPIYACVRENTHIFACICAYKRIYATHGKMRAKTRLFTQNYSDIRVFTRKKHTRTHGNIRIRT